MRKIPRAIFLRSIGKSVGSTAEKNCRYKEQLIWNYIVDLIFKNKSYEKRKVRTSNDALLQAVIRLLDTVS
jgi:hypothetical protein